MKWPTGTFSWVHFEQYSSFEENKDVNGCLIPVVNTLKGKSILDFPFQRSRLCVSPLVSPLVKGGLERSEGVEKQVNKGGVWQEN